MTKTLNIKPAAEFQKGDKVRLMCDFVGICSDMEEREFCRDKLADVVAEIERIDWLGGCQGWQYIVTFTCPGAGLDGDGDPITSYAAIDDSDRQFHAGGLPLELTVLR